MPIAYLSSRYPAVSHSFVWREVEALRALGADVRTLSIWRTGADQLLTAADEEAQRTTFAVLPRSARLVMRAHLRAFAAGPSRYASTLTRALATSAPGLRARLWRLFYFAEAMVVHEHCAGEGIRHLHAQFADAATDVALLVTHYGGAGWTWSMAVHGPVEFSNVELYRLADKVRDARFVQAISDFGRSQLLALVDEEEWPKVHVVRCGVDPAVYAADGDAGGDGPELRILCVGRLVHIKGQSLLIDVVAALVGRGIDVRLVLVGDGPERDRLAAKARRLGVADRVELAGAVGQDEIRNRYLEADVFCLPSFAEGVPVVLMEAMALRRPVVTTRIAGIPELVEDGVSGLLVAPGRRDELVAALAALAADPARRVEMGARGRERVLADFDVNRSAQRLRDLFAAV